MADTFGKGKGVNQSRYDAAKKTLGKDFFKSGPGDAAAPKMNMDNAKAMRFAKGGTVRKFSQGGNEGVSYYASEERPSAPEVKPHHAEIDRELAEQKRTSGKKKLSAFGQAYADARKAGKKDFEFTKADGSKMRYSTESAEEKRARKYADKTDSVPRNTPKGRADAHGTPTYDAAKKSYEDKLDANYGNGSKEISDSYDKAKEIWDYNQAGYKKGGKVKHDDEAQDRKLIKSMIKQEERKEAPMRKAMGGAAKKRRGVI